MQQAKEAQPPPQGKQQVNQRRWIKWHRVPLGEEGHAAVVVWIPQRQFPTPETLALVVRQRIGKKAKVAHDEGLQAEHNQRKSGENQQAKNNRKTAAGEPITRQAGPRLADRPSALGV